MCYSIRFSLSGRSNSAHPGMRARQRGTPFRLRQDKMIRHKSLQEIDRRKEELKLSFWNIPMLPSSALCHGTGTRHWHQTHAAASKKQQVGGRPSPTSPLQVCRPSSCVCRPSLTLHFVLSRHSTSRYFHPPPAESYDGTSCWLPDLPAGVLLLHHNPSVPKSRDGLVRWPCFCFQNIPFQLSHLPGSCSRVPSNH
jgi:hypothetical protein